MVSALRRTAKFLRLLDANGDLSLTNILMLNFSIALTYRMYKFENVGAGDVMIVIAAIASYSWKNHRLAKSWLDRFTPPGGPSS